MALNIQKRFFVNTGFFVSLLLSWWMLAGTVSQNAALMDGKWFEESLAVLGGLYYNDWLPVIAAGAFGLGWIFPIILSALATSRLQEFTLLVFAIFFVPFLGFVFSTRINSLNYPTLEELFSTSLLIYMTGTLNGIFISQLRKMEKSLHV